MSDSVPTYQYVKNAVPETGDGWADLVNGLCKTIDQHLAWKNKNDPEAGYIHVVQIKEKFGGLRFYYDDFSKEKDFIDDAVSLAETMSYHICEQCGATGKTRNDIGWIRTLCDNHYHQAKERYEQRFKQTQ